jgi:hypothetical protein
MLDESNEARNAGSLYIHQGSTIWTVSLICSPLAFLGLEHLPTPRFLDVRFTERPTVSEPTSSSM